MFFHFSNFLVAAIVRLAWRFPGIMLRPRFELRIGPTFRLEQAAGTSSHESLAETVQQIMRHIAALSPLESRGGHGDDPQPVGQITKG